MNPAAALIQHLRGRIDAVLGAPLAECRDVALLDFPNYPNVGDSAIWLGERAWLRDAGMRVRYAADMHTFSAHLLRALLPPHGAILLQGGGNFGDLWEAPQLFRERTIAQFRDRRIIVLPQTMWFERTHALERARRTYDAHPDLTLLLRDERSLEMARAHFQCRAELCPDMAFALGTIERPITATVPLLRLWRTDKEEAGKRADLVLPAGPVADWQVHPESRRYRMIGRLRAALMDRPSGYAATWPLIARLGDLQARIRLRHGCRLLSRAETIATDRLHGHILCLLLGIPHILLDNSYGKIGEFHRAWTRRCPLVLHFESAREGPSITWTRDVQQT